MLWANMSCCHHEWYHVISLIFAARTRDEWLFACAVARGAIIITASALSAGGIFVLGDVGS